MDGEVRTSRPLGAEPPVRVVILSMDAHLRGTVKEAEQRLRLRIPRLSVCLHAASEWEHEGPQRDRVLQSIAQADFLIIGMIFLENQASGILPALQARAGECDAVIGALATQDLVKLTRLGKFRMDQPENGAMALLKKLKPKKSSRGKGESDAKTLRRLPKILKFIPGSAQDVRAYFLAMQYWLGGSDDNVRNMIAALIDRYAEGGRGFRILARPTGGNAAIEGEVTERITRQPTA